MDCNDTENLIRRFEKINTWQQGGKRAPHKPLLVLLALGLFRQGITLLPYAKYEHKLSALLREFGPSRRSFHPEYPFWRLCNDGIWEVEAEREMTRRSSNRDILRTELRAARATGHFPLYIQQKFNKHPALVVKIARSILTAHFPEILHIDILNAVGLPDERLNFLRRRRDPNFRNAVLTAYQHRCALCGLDLRIGTIAVGIEAAHIRWHQANGPDSIDNGLALCSLHHKLFDVGAFTFEITHRVLISEQIQGSEQFEQILLRHHGQRLRVPEQSRNHPLPEFINWHRSEVFKAHARPI